MGLDLRLLYADEAQAQLDGVGVVADEVGQDYPPGFALGFWDQRGSRSKAGGSDYRTIDRAHPTFTRLFMHLLIVHPHTQPPAQQLPQPTQKRRLGFGINLKDPQVYLPRREEQRPRILILQEQIHIRRALQHRKASDIPHRLLL